MDNLSRQDLEKTGVQDFEASLDSSDSGPQSFQYRGVLLKDALEELGIELEDYSSVVAKAVDGYTVAFDISEGERGR
ncbi:MAG: hypothetical protein U5N58_06520 [Actinomycetota bacterium]|nr:hypothetical protein [Actinomycetota bacterium]